MIRCRWFGHHYRWFPAFAPADEGHIVCDRCGAYALPAAVGVVTIGGGGSGGNATGGKLVVEGFDKA